MKGGIDGFGDLFIIRARGGKDTSQIQTCRISGSAGNCNDSCCHFREPDKVCVLGKETEDIKITRIELCHGTILYFEEFTDKRMVKPGNSLFE